MAARRCVDGKFLLIDGKRFLIKGVTYGAFAPDERGVQYPSRDRVAADFAAMERHGINLVRTYTVPPRSLLDEAARHNLRVMAGVCWPQHVVFLDDRRARREVRRRVVSQVAELGNHPAVLVVALGNEIPASVVRWHGRSATERFVEDLYHDARSVAPDALLTYVNYPPTEYLDLPFLDVVAFNVYLHREPELRAYIARLQHIAGGKPLLMAEQGADSHRHGQAGQSDLTSMQIRAAFREGACGAIAFAWTDDWWSGGFQVEDWAFGLVDAERRPKLALNSVAATFNDAPFGDEQRAAWPKVSVVVCAFNAASTIDECLTSLERQRYPDYEIIVVDDGSRDRTREIVRRHPGVKLVNAVHAGLSAARNIGVSYSSGTIVAYTDADVHVDPDWLAYLVQPLVDSDVAGSGGPNVVPPDDPWMAQCVARAPGAPTHVLIDDRTAEHVAGCNMAFRREVLLEIGGFNPIYARAGDDVDLCWRVQSRGWKIGFAPAALVWHHHRNSIREYWRQQVGYGEGEQWLLPHHPDRFDNGRPVWRGHIYSPLPFNRALSRASINTGPWGMAPFPSVYRRDAYPFAFMPHRVWWSLATISLVILGAALVRTSHGETALLLLSIGALGLAATLARCLLFAFRSDIASLPRIGWLPAAVSRVVYGATIAMLHFVQPFAREAGRLRGLLTDAHLPGVADADPRTSRPGVWHLSRTLLLAAGLDDERQFWGETTTDAQALLTRLHQQLCASRAPGIVIDDGWQTNRDISVRVSTWSWIDLRVLVEHHAPAKRLARARTRLRFTPAGLAIIALSYATLVAAITSALNLGATLTLLLAVAGISLAGRWLWRATETFVAVQRTIEEAALACYLRPIQRHGGRTSPAAHAAAIVKETPSLHH
jgi:GT2 family glycosyltransferase